MIPTAEDLKKELVKIYTNHNLREYTTKNLHKVIKEIVDTNPKHYRKQAIKDLHKENYLEKVAKNKFRVTDKAISEETEISEAELDEFKRENH